jgi:hypothetical protein
MLRNSLHLPELSNPCLCRSGLPARSVSRSQASRRQVSLRKGETLLSANQFINYFVKIYNPKTSLPTSPSLFKGRVGMSSLCSNKKYFYVDCFFTENDFGVIYYLPFKLFFLYVFRSILDFVVVNEAYRLNFFTANNVILL